MKQLNILKVDSLMVFSALFHMFALGQNLRVELIFLNQMSAFLQKLESSLEVQRQKKSFQAILVIVFSNCTVFQYRSNLPQIKRNLISSIINLSYEFPIDLRLRILGIQKILEKSKVDIKNFWFCPIGQYLKNIKYTKNTFK